MCLCLSLSFLLVPINIHLSKATSEGQVKEGASRDPTKSKI